MSGLGKFIVMFLTMIVFLEFVGVPTGASVLLSSFNININPNTTNLENGDLGNSSFYAWFLAALAVVSAGGAVVIGLFAKSYDTSLVVAPLILSIASIFISTAWTVISYCQGLGVIWLTKIVAVVFIGLGAGFLWSCVDYFRTGA